VTENDYQRQLGDRLRAIRAQQDLTLQDVEDRSDGRWKAVVVGSYERGDRSITISKLAELGRFYGVPLADLLPPTVRRADVEDDPDRPPRFVLDLTRLEDGLVTDPSLSGLRRYAHRIQVRRGDYNGRVLTLRSNDLAALAAVIDTEPDALVNELQTRQILRTT
jgi:transcriptional regulator with XRE-family HTH domain